MDLAYVDYGLGAVVALFLLHGLLRGIIKEVCTMAGLFGAYVVSGQYYLRLLPYVQEHIGNPALAAKVSYVAMFLGALAALGIIFAVLRRVLRVVITPWLDAVAGGAFGAVLGGVVASGVMLVLRYFDAGLLNGSRIAPHLEPVARWMQGHLPAVLQM